MAKYILKRLGYMILTLWVVITITFFLMNLMPGNPIRTQAKQLPEEVKVMLETKYGLNQPVTTRYVKYMKNLLQGDFGDSFVTPGYSVNEIIKDKFPASARIGLQAVLIGIIIGISLGIIAAFKRNTPVDFVVMLIAILGVSIPSFVLAAMLQTTFGGKMGLPIAGWYDLDSGFFEGIKYTILPTIALCFGSIAVYGRYMRASVLDVIGQDYIVTAEAKGVSKFILAWKHIIRNAILPIVTMVGPQIATIITGSIVIERIFSIPGLGNSMVDAIQQNDYNVIMGLTIFFSLLYIVSLLVVDVLYCVVDPRIKLADKK